MEIRNFAKKRPHLFWYIQDFESLSEEAIVEAVLNLGNWKDTQELIEILGIKKTAEIFKKRTARKRNNYRPEIKNYFELYFKKYAQ
ncbi:MAG: hypothetical protein WA055_01060 [Candidatus Moraniibacteriota bacterium]